MKGEFCRLLTKDGIELHAFYVSPSGRRRKTTVVHVHGFAGNFYENRFIDYVAESLADQGVSFLTFNNRGHDYISDVLCERKKGSIVFRLCGGSYDTFTDCLEDIRAAADFAASRGATRIILQGHSYGAVKAAYYLSQITDPRIKGLILLSPSDTFGVQRRALDERFPLGLEYAYERINRNHPEDFMLHGYFRYPMSAHTYADMFDEESLAGIFNLSRTDREEFPELAAIRLPVLAAVGTVEEYFLGTPEQFLLDLQTQMKNAPSFTGYVAVGAPHNYLGHETKLTRVISDWVSEQCEVRTPKYERRVRHSDFAPRRSDD